jgi:DNA-binding NtrC family response regulator
MNVETLIFEPPGWQFGQLRREFRLAAPRDWDVRLVSTVDELFDRLHASSADHLVILPETIDDAGRSGTELIAPIRQLGEEIPIVITADTGNVMLVAQAIEAGASDFFVRGERLRERIATLLGKLKGLFEVIQRNRRLREDNASLREAIQAGAKIVGDSPQVRQLLEQIRRVAPVPRPVLIVGERGTGKELVARAIHFAAGSSTRPIVTVNCAAFNDALLESELFGHEKGAFTGADSARAGKFEQADKGTLFLDEISHMSRPFQEKILRVVEYGTYTRVGGTTDRTSSCRIIAATNRDLQEMIAKGEFLADLHDRLAFETIRVPPLRERQGDIAVLSQFFLDQFARDTPAFGGKRLSTDTLAILGQYRFPGNVRELKNLIERAAYRDTTSEITPGDLGLLPHIDLASPGGSFYEKMNAFGRRLIEDTLRHAAGNQAEAARQLGLSYHQFRYYHKKYASTCPGEKKA